jgi:hypothetical protein
MGVMKSELASHLAAIDLECFSIAESDSEFLNIMASTCLQGNGAKGVGMARFAIFVFSSTEHVKLLSS